jgi:hypothetical protein
MEMSDRNRFPVIVRAVLLAVRTVAREGAMIGAEGSAEPLNWALCSPLDGFGRDARLQQWPLPLSWRALYWLNW